MDFVLTRSFRNTQHKQKPEDDLNSIKQLGLYDIGQTIGSGTFSKVHYLYLYMIYIPQLLEYGVAQQRKSS